MTNGARKMEKHGRKKVTKKEVAVLLAVAVAAVVLLIGVVVFLIVRSAKKPAQDPTPVTTTAATTVQTTTETTVATTAATTVATTQKPTVKSLPTKPVTTAAPVGNHYVQPEGAVWYLKLANDWNTLPESYDSTFTAVEYGGGLSGKLFDSRAVDALREMLAAGNAENAALRLQPVSCYRSVALQKSLYERQVQKQKNACYSDAKAREVAATIVKRPGQSEHNTGLAADLGGSGDYSLNQSFERTAAYRWLIEHCADYGFILRFPKDKEAVTGVIYEPWHFRYVGKEAAAEIMRDGLCLEEYLEKHGY